jgi:hypothetical protein
MGNVGESWERLDHSTVPSKVQRSRLSCAFVHGTGSMFMCVHLCQCLYGTGMPLGESLMLKNPISNFYKSQGLKDLWLVERKLCPSTLPPNLSWPPLACKASPMPHLAGSSLSCRA